MRIAINTGGGDAPGLNAAIRAATLSALQKGWEVIGIRNGYGSLLADDPLVELTADAVHGITMQGGTILGTANKGNPFEFPYQKEDGSWDTRDESDRLVERFHELEIDALIAIGGDGSMRIANKLIAKGIKIVGIPKTIDNDVWGVDATLGFDTAVTTATEAIDKITTTAEAHRRIMVVEVMGRYAGWIGLHAGIAASADVILIPEIDFNLEKVAAHISNIYEHGQGYAIVVVSEGARNEEGELETKGKNIGQEVQLGGIAKYVSDELEERVGEESRNIVLGHLQRGGSPSTTDRLISLRYGAEAVRALEEEDFNKLVALHENDLVRIPIPSIADKMKCVPLDGDTVRTARDIGISLGD